MGRGWLFSSDVHGYGTVGCVMVLCVAMTAVLAVPAQADAATLPRIEAMPAAGRVAGTLTPSSELKRLHEAYAGEALVGALAGAAETPLPFVGGYYWAGNDLYIEGTITNDTAQGAGPVGVHITIRDSIGTLIEDSVAYAPVYDLHPGMQTPLLVAIDLPDHAGAELDVTAVASGTQPCQYTNVVDLAIAGSDFLGEVDGTRTWFASFTNSSPYAITAPVATGWEYDEQGRVACLMPAFGLESIHASHGVLGLNVTGVKPGVSPTWIEYFGQAIAVRHTEHHAIYRFYHTRNNAHVYTESPTEAERLRATAGFTDEGVAFYTDLFNNTVPLFRFLNLRTGSHFYTANLSEVETVRDRWPHIYKLEGLAFRANAEPVENSIAVHRFYNLQNGSHFYTPNQSEVETVRQRWPLIYRYEGVAFWIGQ